MDRIWIAHIGLMLCCTFIVLFGITYLSFDYLGSIKITFDTSNNKLVFGQVDRNFWTVLQGVLIATVIGGIVFLFDRAIFLSDWFYQKSYMNFVTEKDKKKAIIEAVIYFFSVLFMFGLLYSNYEIITANSIDYKGISVIVFFMLCILTITLFALSQVKIYATEYKGQNVSAPEMTAFQKFFRVFLRLSISVCVAYALSIFLELRLYESNILGVIKEEHYANNKILYDDFETKAKNIAKQIKEKEKLLTDLHSQLTQISNGADIDVDAFIKQRDEANNNFNVARTKELKELEEQHQKTLKPLNARLDELENKRNELVSKLLIAEDRLVAAKNGDPLDEYEDIKNKPGCGPQCRTIGAQITGLKEEKSYIEEQVKKQLDEINKITSQYKKKEQQILQSYKTQQKTVEDNNQKLINTKLNLNQRNAKSRENSIGILKERINTTQSELEKLQEEKPKKIDALRGEIESDPSYKPLKAGPLERLKALEKIRQDKATGEVITHFSLWVKLFLIFLEVIPVVTKMFFSPPSVYATLVQKETFLETAKLKLEIEKENYREKFMEAHSDNLVLDEKNRLIIEQQTNKFKKALEEELAKRTTEEILHEDKMNMFGKAQNFNKHSDTDKNEDVS